MYHDLEARMQTRPLAVHVRYQADVPIIELHGELDALSDTVLQAAYTEAATHSASRMILLNFIGVGYIRRRGIALLVALLKRAQKAQQQLIICGLSEHDQQIFSITRLSDVMRVFPDEAQALAALTQTAGISR